MLGRRARALPHRTRRQAAWPHRRARRQHVGDPLQFADRNGDRDDDKAANDGGGPADDERVTEAEFVDRDAVSHHPDAHYHGQRADNKQQT